MGDLQKKWVWEDKKVNFLNLMLSRHCVIVQAQCFKHERSYNELKTLSD